MSQRSSSRNACTREQPMTRAKSSESNRCGRPQANCKVIEPIQEECAENNDSRINEDQCCPYDDQEPRYDPKELRDAVKILNPFVRLIKDTNNPYARIVAREVCKTFYRLFHPNIHPIDVMKTINWRAKTIRTQQLWNEFWLYVPGSKVEEWVSLRECIKNDNLIDFSDYCNPCQMQTGNCNSQVAEQQCPLNQSRNENCVQRRSTPRRRNRCYQTQRNFEHINLEDMCDFVSHPSLYDVSPPCVDFDHQSAGADNLPYTHNSESKVPKTTSPRTHNQNKHELKLDSKQHREKISGTQCQLEQLDESTSKKCRNGFEDAMRKIKIKNCTSQCKRQNAGNDFHLPYSKPSCSNGQACAPKPNPGTDAAQHEYYRITANTPSPPRYQNNTSCRPLPKTPVEPELRTNALQCSLTGNDEDCSDSDSVDSVKSVQQIVCKSSLVANAFTNLSLAKKDLQTKTEAFNMLTQHYLNFASNPIEADPPCENSPTAKMILQAIYKNPPKIIKPFNDCEWNDNAFHDKDFIRLLPFYESVHNQLEYISKTQRDYGINMLDDIMSTLYHIHYDLGDPRLKNDMLLEHVKLITRNTWESYFYKDKKMPAIPDKPLVSYRPSPQNTPQQLCPIQPRQQSCPRQPSPVQRSCPRQVCPKPPNQRPPNVRQPVSSLSNPSGQSSGGRPCSSNAPKPNVNRRPGVTCPQEACNPPAENKRTFLRRSRPSGAPKGWAPKLKQADRPDTLPAFKAKPLPKFVRDRLNNRNEAC
ncbi:uncharacterized protein LOC111030113 [Myzus persicae]|uniref:uncharacterized protein LOC111030113 n=1 Tax=Myzus persicae TaxID=13164 RepID=UPI000B930810|nr:uncharacterized protein LOC111030113 [Myzus persicae]